MKEKRLHDDKIELIHVTKKFGQELVLKEVNLTLEQGRVYGIVGNNGSGKTVLMKCICGFLIPTTGLIQVFGSSIGQDVDFPESLGVIIETQVGLDPALKKPVANYSLGMRQRLGIAQAIMEDPKLLILDEPFNGLDKHGVGEIRKLLLELKEEGKTILLASHNEEDIRILCDEVYEMDGGVLRKCEDEIRK